jgi:hypothetical protein
MDALAQRVRSLKAEAALQEGRNVVDAAFQREVDALLGAFYDDIGRIVQIDLKSLFDLFLLKGLYVARRSTSIATLDYLSDLLAGFLRAQELSPLPNLGEVYARLLPRLMEETRQRGRAQNLFEAYRRLGDNSLFLTGLFPHALARRWGRSGLGSPVLNRSFYIRIGKDYYAQAAGHELAGITGQSPVLARLSRSFEIYADALNDISERYILDFDREILADKMLDNFNLYRRTREEVHLENARKYAALLQVDRRAFSRLWRHPRRYALLK